MATSPAPSPRIWSKVCAHCHSLHFSLSLGYRCAKTHDVPFRLLTPRRAPAASRRNAQAVATPRRVILSEVEIWREAQKRRACEAGSRRMNVARALRLCNLCCGGGTIPPSPPFTQGRQHKPTFAILTLPKGKPKLCLVSAKRATHTSPLPGGGNKGGARGSKAYEDARHLLAHFGGR